MKTVTLEKTLYTIHELDERALEKALSDFCASSDYPWADENEGTLDVFTNIFPVRVRKWEYGGYSCPFIDFTMTCDDEIADLSGWRLATYIWNNYRHDLYKGKYYSKGKYVNGKYTYKARYSKILLDSSCVLTGYCMDDEILAPIYEFLKKPDSRTFEDLMGDCLDAWVQACNEDYESYFSMENFIDMCDANNWEFDEYGRL